VFPLGELDKSEVRRLAHEAALPVFDKKDSTGICFIGERPFRQFLSEYLPAQPGDIETGDGQRIGEHIGLMYYTLGQREGLGVGGVAAHAEQAWYVAAKDIARNVLIVVQGRDHPRLLCSAMRTEAIHGLGATLPRVFRCSVKTRYRQADVACEVELGPEGALVRFGKPQRAVTPGQFAVFYDGERCLGGAVIASALQSQTRADVDDIIRGLANRSGHSEAPCATASGPAPR
jgi:tRNA-specific 2-thiouridylase